MSSRLQRLCAAGSAVVLALTFATGCSLTGGRKQAPAHPEARTTFTPKGAWIAAHLRLISGVSGTFSSLVSSLPCPQPPAGACTVGGALIEEAGVFALSQNTAAYVHKAVGNGADISEASGYKVRSLANGEAYTSSLARRRRAGCWAPTFAGRAGFGSKWLTMPAGFFVLLDADADHDPPVTGKAAEIPGHASADTVLRYLGLDDYSFDFESKTVPVQLRLGDNGLPSGFTVVGTAVARALVGPAPTAGPTGGAAFVPGATGFEERDAELRRTLAPMRGEFTVSRYGKTHVVSAPPARVLISHNGRGDDPCPGGS